MKSNYKKRLSKGFSLIELMVVVAIVGALAAIGVPTYYNLIARTRKSEAVVNLAAIFKAEQNFHAEFGTFYDGLVVLGYRPVGILHYNIGFGGSLVPTIPLAVLQAHGFTAALPPSDYRSTGTLGAANFCGFTVINGNGCGVLSDGGTLSPNADVILVGQTASAFTAAACGRVSSTSTVTGAPGGCETGRDEWQITDQNVLTHTQDGT